MIIIIGLVILAAAAVAGVAGFFNNIGSGHAVQGTFEVFGYHVTGSTGTLFLFGAVVGAIGMLGLALLLAGARRTSRRGQEARRALKQSQHENAASSEHRDTLVEQRDSARAETASAGQEHEELTQQRDELTRQREELTRQREDLTKQRESLINQRERAYAASPGDSARARQRVRDDLVSEREELASRRERLNAASPGTGEVPLPSEK
jgi:hypothetical protein